MTRSFVILATLAAVLGGTLFAAGTTWDIVQRFTPEEVPLSQEAQTRAYQIEMTIMATSMILLGLGVLGIYLAFAERLGTAGLVTSLLAFVGTVLVFGLLFHDAAFLPWLAAQAPEVVDGEPAPGGVFFLAFVTFLLGLTAFCVTMLVRGTPFRPAVVMILVGLIGDFVFEGWLAPVIGLGLVWTGLLAWGHVRSQSTAPVAASALAAPTR